MRTSLPSLWGRNNEEPFAALRREFDQFLADFGQRWPTFGLGSTAQSALAAVNVADTKEAIEVSVELPGVTEKDVSVTVEGDSLVIAGEKRSETESKEKDWQVVECSYGAFRRVVPLPFAPDAGKVEANFDKGVLTVKVAKPAEIVTKTVEIPIKNAA